MSLVEWDAYARLPLDVARAEGDELVLADGRRLIDLYGGHCVHTLGGGDPQLTELLRQQWSELSFVTNLVEHPVRSEVLAALEPGMPPGAWHVFFSNSGAEANENALKAAFLATGRTRAVAFDAAFHGRTAGADGITDGARAYPRMPFDCERVPWGDLEAAERAIDADVACVCLEPLPSLAGVLEPPPGFLEGLRTLCDESGALLVFDEVQTGSGRTGETWAARTFGVTPDLFTTAKGAAGGLPIGMTCALEGVASAVPRGHMGSTFGGGPVVLKAAAHVARRVGEPAFLAQVRASGEALRAAALRGPVREVRGRGLLLGLQLEGGIAARDVQASLIDAGILTGTSRDPSVLRLSPPLTLDADRAAPLLAQALEHFGAPA